MYVVTSHGLFGVVPRQAELVHQALDVGLHLRLPGHLGLLLRAQSSLRGLLLQLLRLLTTPKDPSL